MIYVKTQVPIVKSSSPERLEENLQVLDFELSDSVPPPPFCLPLSRSRFLTLSLSLSLSRSLAHLLSRSLAVSLSRSLALSLSCSRTLALLLSLALALLLLLSCSRSLVCERALVLFLALYPSPSLYRLSVNRQSLNVTCVCVSLCVQEMNKVRSLDANKRVGFDPNLIA